MRVIYTNFMWPSADAMYLGVCVLIRPKYRDDNALLAHEMVHHEQNKRHWFFFIRYLTSKKFRLEMEVEAYRVQVAIAPSSLDACAKALAENYGLNLPVAYARQLITNR